MKRLVKKKHKSEKDFQIQPVIYQISVIITGENIFYSSTS